MMVQWKFLKLNLYSTAWNDRIATRTVINEDGDDDIICLTELTKVTLELR